jgi:hypothetical protein
MRRSQNVRASIAGAVLVSIATGHPAFAADDRAVCIAAAEEAQALRDQGKLRAAHEKLVVCGQKKCPAVISSDCAKWIGEVEELMPGVVVVARDAGGADTVAVRVLVDGALMQERLDGKAIRLDPGPHTLRFEHEGSAPVQRSLVLAEGDRHRVVEVAFDPAQHASADVSTRAAGTPVPEPSRSTPIGETVVPYVVGGAGVLALAAFTFLGLQARSDFNALRDRCAPACDASEVSPVRTKALVADVFLGVGVLGVGIATWMFLSSHSRQQPKVTAALSF